MLPSQFARGIFLVPCLCLAWLASGGCSSTPPPADALVTGVVTYGGEPVWEGRVTFLGSDNRIASAALAADGSFRLANPPLGKVRVAVTNHPTTGPLPGQPQDDPPLPGQALCLVPARPVVVLPGRYWDPFESGVTVEVEPGEQHVAVRLARRKGDPELPGRAGLPAMGVEVGQVAPEITGDDLEGNPLRLSDHRGKVVALLFWGHW